MPVASLSRGVPSADDSAEPAREAPAEAFTGTESETESGAEAATGASTEATGSGRSTAWGGSDGASGRSAMPGVFAGLDWAGLGSAGLVAALVDAASALALAEPPEVSATCLAEAQELVYARDRLVSAIAARVDRVHRTDEARSHGHSSTQVWLRSGCGASRGSASYLVMLGTQLARLPIVRARFAEGSLAEGQVGAICIAVKKLTDEQAAIAEPILVELADNASPEDVAKAGRYLGYVLDPDGPRKGEDDEESDYRKRYLEVRPTDAGGMEGEFHLPKESAARLKAWLDAYAKPRSENDDRSLRQRNADALNDLLAKKVTTELVVLVNAESLPGDQPTPDYDTHGDDGTGGLDDADGVDGAGGREDTGRRAREQSAHASSVTRHHGQPESGDRGRRLLRWKVPGLLLATGQFLSPADIARLARTSTLMRLVMDADGQVLDMGRAVRLATNPQRKAVFARYGTCWIDGCPLPATLCQVDHADNWVAGGLTNLKLLGPACQHHNRDRYRHPERYVRRREGKDRWAYTYTGPRYRTRRRRTSAGGPPAAGPPTSGDPP
ncbi:HNH endonuclease signature motif containing protein [Planotetraspora thailandica]|uniref:HNH endonuclease signature motif containing protein n=1 Tax=Planotetraspora thailandica TaxID=487172 RepID=UPI003671EB8C